jgi:magnesium-transporting ATPase (P-type)
MDPPRPSAMAAIAVAQRAGITVKMITGDHPATALAIGKMLGLGLKRHGDDVESGGHMERAVTGGELDELILHNTVAFDECVKNNDIFARTTPEHKIRIVQSLLRQKFVCSMTGDGVNDAPALKAANIGVAMGITGVLCGIVSTSALHPLTILGSLQELRWPRTLLT